MSELTDLIAVQQATKAKLEDNLSVLNINTKKNSEKIIKGINLLRLGNNPVKIDGNDIYKIISK